MAKLIILIFYFLDIAEAKQRFKMYQKCIPLLLQVDESLCTQSQLQVLCDTCRQHPSNTNFTPLHLAIELDLKNALMNEHLLAFLNTSDSQGK